MDLMRREKEIMEEEEVYEFHQNPQPTQPEKTATFSLDYEDEEKDEILHDDEVEKWAKTRLTTIEDLENHPSFVKNGFLKYNTALCSQAGVERTFSFGKLVFGQLRRNLYDENFEKHLIMKANRKLNPKLFEKTE